tara:strand:- start:7097 stop:7879 length:783 start_codon:yes stop_codon:yes gene_type:complete
MINHQNKGRLDFRAGYPRGCDEGIDIVFLVDFTGSMGDEIEQVKTSILEIVNTVIAESRENYRLGLVLFDETATGQLFNYATKPDYTSLPAAQRYINLNEPVTRKQAITAMEVMSQNNQTSFTTQLNKINTPAFPRGGGASAPEPGGLGYEQILDGIAGEFRQDVSRLVLLITDAVPGGDDDTFNSTDQAFLTSLAARSLDLRVQALILSSREDVSENEYKILSNGTNGSYTFDDLTNTPAAIIEAIEDICVINNEDAED